MKEHGLTSTQLNNLFNNRVQQMALQVNRTVMNWEDAFFLPNSSLRSDTIVEVWRDVVHLQKVATSNYKTILAAGWYIGKSSHWTDFYDNEPFKGNWSNFQKENVLGGETCIWGCSGFCPFPITEKDFDYYVWPVACATAERLWSDQSITSHSNALARLIIHRERLLSRGVQAGEIN